MDKTCGTLERPRSSSFLARLFNVRWELGFYGNDPCDEWDIDEVLGLPDGLYYRNGRLQFEAATARRGPIGREMTTSSRWTPTKTFAAALHGAAHDQPKEPSHD